VGQQFPPLPEDRAVVSILIGHADRVWKAAEANGTRLGTRASILASAASALLGLTLFALGKEWETILSAKTPVLTSFFIATGALAVISLALTLFTINATWWPFRPRRCPCTPRHPFSSGALELPDEIGDEPWKADEAAAVWSVYIATYDAGRELEGRNIDRQKALDWGGWCVFSGFVFILASMILYALIAYNSVAREEADVQKPNHRQHVPPGGERHRHPAYWGEGDSPRGVPDGPHREQRSVQPSRERKPL
jgi:hypothetical protein